MQIFSYFHDTTEILIYREEIDMLDRSIPFYNTILRCDSYKYREVILPDKFSIVPYEKGYEKAWADLEYSAGDFDSLGRGGEFLALNGIRWAAPKTGISFSTTFPS